MNLFILFLVTSSVGIGANGASLGSAHGQIKERLSKAKQEMHNAIEMIDQQQRKLRMDNDPHETSCDCSKEAQLEVWNTYKEVVEDVPQTFLGLLNLHSETIGDSIGLEYDPLSDYKYLLPALKYLLDTATDTLKCIHCGPCNENEGYHIENDMEKIENPSKSISHFECCCDVELIKDIAIKQMYAMAEIINLNLGASSFTEIARESIQSTTGATIHDIARPYECKEHKCPCFTLADIIYADRNREFHMCQSIPNDRRKIVDFDVVVRKDERSYAFCVGNNCEKNCKVDEFNGNCIWEFPGELKCYSGTAYLGRPYPYDWSEDAVQENISQEEYEACCDIIAYFCASKGDPIRGISGDEGISGDSVGTEDPDDKPLL